MLRSSIENLFTGGGNLTVRLEQFRDLSTGDRQLAQLSNFGIKDSKREHGYVETG